MTLLQATEPIFQYVCRLNRIARHQGSASSASVDKALAAAAKTGAPTVAKPGTNLTFDTVREEVLLLFEEMASKAGGDIRSAQQLKKIEFPLIFFVDSMISESKLPFAEEWNQNRLAYERDELAGDEKFFNLLEDTLKESGDEASERLSVLYVCVGLGFTGIYFKQPEYLRRIMLGLAPRVRQWVENDQRAKVCPEAYTGVDSRNFVKPASNRMAIVGLVFLSFSLAVILSYLWIMKEASTTLKASFGQTLEKEIPREPSK